MHQWMIMECGIWHQGVIGDKFNNPKGYISECNCAFTGSFQWWGTGIGLWIATGVGPAIKEISRGSPDIVCSFWWGQILKALKAKCSFIHFSRRMQFSGVAGSGSLLGTGGYGVTLIVIWLLLSTQMRWWLVSIEVCCGTCSNRRLSSPAVHVCAPVSATLEICVVTPMVLEPRYCPSLWKHWLWEIGVG